MKKATLEVLSFLLLTITFYGQTNVLSGVNAGTSLTTTGVNNVFTGFRAGTKTTTGDNNVFIGYEAGRENTTGSDQVFIGFQAGLQNTMKENVFIGSEAGFRNKGSYNVFTGYQAGFNDIWGTNNLFTGYQAGFNNHNGNQNVYIGNGAGRSITTGDNNVFMGFQAANNLTAGVNNTFVGTNAGSRSTAINTTTQNNTYLGANAGFNSTGNNSIFLGNGAGTNVIGSDKLYIDNSSTPTPLIYGDFANNQVGINTTTVPSGVALAVNGNVAVGGLNASEVLATSFKKVGGLADQFLMADGSTTTRVGNSTSTNAIQNQYGAPQSANMWIDGNAIFGGNVGIGTTAPAAKLHVYGQENGAFNGLVIDNRKNYGSGSGIQQTSRMLLSLSENGANPIDRVFGMIEAGTLSETDSSNGRLSFYAREGGGVAEKMRINSNGNVGINTTTDNGVDKLQVQGSAFFNGANIKIAQGAGFENGYFALLESFHAEDTGLLSFKGAGGGGKAIGVTGYGSDTQLFSDTSEKVRIKGNGNVGIGTTAPLGKLDVNGAVFLKGKAIIDSDGVNSYFKSNVDSYFQNNGRVSAIITSNGNVGIGTTTPTAKLHINNGNNSYGAILANSDESPFSLYTKSLTTDVYKESFRLGLKYDNNEKNGFISFFRGGDSSGGFLGFSTDGVERMKIDSNGYVGIGTANPDQKLTVNGTIHSKEVIVDTAITPDFVFQKYYTGKSDLKSDYTVPTLTEIEAFTKKNHHLPNVPSAATIKEKGLQLGEMSNVLLQKIEELTLYAIEQQKELDRLKTENNNYRLLAERLSAVEKQLKK